jgi:hypothetical protein
MEYLSAGFRYVVKGRFMVSPVRWSTYIECAFRNLQPGRQDGPLGTAGLPPGL